MEKELGNSLSILRDIADSFPDTLVAFPTFVDQGESRRGLAMTDTVEGADEDGAGESNSVEVPDGGRERSLTFDVEMQDDSDSGQWGDTESTSSDKDEDSLNFSEIAVTLKSNWILILFTTLTFTYPITMSLLLLYLSLLTTSVLPTFSVFSNIHTSVSSYQQHFSVNKSCLCFRTR
jgi:hypothetical protein